MEGWIDVQLSSGNLFGLVLVLLPICRSPIHFSQASFSKKINQFVLAIHLGNGNNQGQ